MHEVYKCPACAQLVPREGAHSLLRCWNCGMLHDYSATLLPEERLLRWVGSLRALDLLCLPFHLPSPSLLHRFAARALLVTLPVAVVMLTVCNSLELHVVRDPVAPYELPLNSFRPEEEDLFP